MDRQTILKQFHKPDDKLLCGKAVDRAFLCVTRHQPAFSDFLDPARTEKLLAAFAREQDFTVVPFGGFDGAERRMLGFFPPYAEAAESAFPIQRLRVAFDAKFAKTVRHQDFLGAALSLGIDRAKLGDIVIYEREAAIFAEAGVADFLAGALTKVGSAAVSTQIAEGGDEVFALEPVEEARLTVASARADALAAAAFRLSRGETAELAAKGRLFINWQAVNGAKEAAEGDMVSLRGYGRFRIIEISVTKKDRLSVRISL